MISVTVKTWLNSKQLKAAVKEASMPRIKKAAFLVERDAKLSMKAGGRKTGPGGGKVYVPAPPDTPPHVQTGNLRASIQSAPTKWLTYLVGPTLQAWYGRLHEFGSRTRPKRPFMRPALKRMQKRFPALFKGLQLAKTPSGAKLNRAKGPL